MQEILSHLAQIKRDIREAATRCRPTRPISAGMSGAASAICGRAPACETEGII